MSQETKLDKIHFAIKEALYIKEKILFKADLEPQFIVVNPIDFFILKDNHFKDAPEQCKYQYQGCEVLRSSDVSQGTVKVG